jgi:hypothetical protein
MTSKECIVQICVGQCTVFQPTAAAAVSQRLCWLKSGAQEVKIISNQRSTRQTPVFTRNSYSVGLTMQSEPWPLTQSGSEQEAAAVS